MMAAGLISPVSAWREVDGAGNVNVSKFGP